MHCDSSSYRGRFAPSPTGPLHLGSLISALASYLDARACGGAWLVRMEDLDPPREQPGAAQSILASLEAHGLHWDGPVLWQSERHDAYREALAILERNGRLFHCDCTRALLGPGGACAGRCRPRQTEVAQPCSLRIAVPAETEIQFDDRLQGLLREPLGATLPDFTLIRKDGLFAYQLAVVVDDGFQGINQVVRGSDLLDSTARQIYLQAQLSISTPTYTHHPVITNEQGQKLSKQNQAPALDDRRACQNLCQALQFLGQPAPAALDSPEDILAFAIEHWRLTAVPARLSQEAAVLGRVP